MQCHISFSSKFHTHHKSIQHHNRLTRKLSLMSPSQDPKSTAIVVRNNPFDHNIGGHVGGSCRRSHPLQNGGAPSKAKLNSEEAKCRSAKVKSQSA